MGKTLVLFLILFGVVGIARGQRSSGPAQGNASPGAAAQENDPQTPQQEAALQIAEGTLSKVDAQKQLLWIKTKEGKEMQFSYTKDTAVEGAGDSVEGLAKMGNSELKVHYSSAGGVNTAVRIEAHSNA